MSAEEKKHVTKYAVTLPNPQNLGAWIQVAEFNTRKEAEQYIRSWWQGHDGNVQLVMPFTQLV